MSRILRKAWPFLVILGLMGLYFVAAPIIHDRLFVVKGKPIQVNVKLPATVNESRSGVDALVINNEPGGVYQLWGWAFPMVDKSIPAGDYERQVVLVAPSGNYVFATEAVERTDVQKYFSDLSMDVTMSGFSAFIASHTLEPGIYEIGLIFKNTTSSVSYYMSTGRCVTRTPNTLVLEDPGKSVQVNVELPVEVIQAKSGVDAVGVINEQAGVYNFWGWAFLTTDKSLPASDYERQLVLVSPTGNYVFAAEAVERTDVQKYFNDLGVDVTMSGVSALINRNALELGIYGIGLIFKNPVSGVSYYISTGRCLTRTPNTLVLEDPGSSACQSVIDQYAGKPVQVNVELPATVSESRSGVDALVIYNEQGRVYQLWGWAFPMVDRSIPTGDYERQVVLATPTGNYVFASETVERTDVQEYFNDLGMELTNSGFSALISKDVIELGEYRLGIVFRNPQDNTVYYVDTRKILINTPDQLRLSDPFVTP